MLSGDPPHVTSIRGRPAAVRSSAERTPWDTCVPLPEVTSAPSGGFASRRGARRCPGALGCAAWSSADNLGWGLSWQLKGYTWQGHQAMGWDRDDRAQKKEGMPARDGLRQVGWGTRPPRSGGPASRGREGPRSWQGPRGAPTRHTEPALSSCCCHRLGDSTSLAYAFIQSSVNGAIHL